MNDIAEVVEYLERKQLTLVTAESCTAGLVCSLIADIPGCGPVLQGGYMVYSPRAKQQCLGVSAATIKEFGLTSEEVAREMALGALRNSSADLALAITGKAESDDELDGVICFAYAMIDRNGLVKIASETVKFEGARNEVRKLAARHAILKLPVFIEKHSSQARRRHR